MTENYSIPVRPAGVNGQPFWNRNVMLFMYAPSFDFAEVKGAVSYRYEVIDDLHNRRCFTAPTPKDFLSPVWNELPDGFVSVTVCGLDADGKVLGEAGRRVLVKKAPYRPGTYPPAKRSYEETIRMIFDNRYSIPEVKDILAGKEPTGFNFPTKQIASLIDGATRRAVFCPETAEESLRFIRNACDYLISVSEPAGAPLEYLAPTYNADETVPEWKGTTMMLYPVAAMQSYLNAYKVTKDEKYLTATLNTAKTLMRLQGEDGSWPLKMKLTGEVIGTNRCLTVWFYTAFADLYNVTGDKRYLDVADKAFAFMENGPMKTWNWEGQFEDTPATAPYMNLTKHDACSTAIYIVNRYPGDAKRIAQARELLRFAEDVFVFWENPYASGRIIMPEEGQGYYNHYWEQKDWLTPCVVEQFGCFTPVDASAGKLVRTYLALYKAEHNELDLAKAHTLADSITRMTDDDGLESTWWCTPQLRTDIWTNCMLACELALEEILKYK